MSQIVTFQGNIVASPGQVSDCAFPGAITQIVFGGGQNIPANTSVLHAKSVNSPTVYVTLDGLGAGETVSQGVFLYLKTNAQMTLRLTTQGTPDLVAEVPIFGTVIWQFPSTNYLKLLEVKGVGTLEYLIAGNA